MEIYQSEDFIEKFSENVKGSLFDVRLSKLKTKINRTLQKENLYFDNEGYLILQNESKESETKICNFFVLPTHSLYFDDGEKIHEAGIAVELYSSLNDDKYKRILVNLSDQAIEKGNWLTTEYIDRDFFIYRSELYRYLRIALKLSSRILKVDAKKVFYDDMWLEDDEANEYIFDTRLERDLRSIRKSGNGIEFTHKEEAVQFLVAQRQYITEIKLLPFPEKPSDKKDEYGWEDNDHFYLIYKNAWSWIRAYFNRNGVKLNATSEKELDHYLIEAGVFESNEKRSKTNLKRADQRISTLTERVFKINKVRFNEFLFQK